MMILANHYAKYGSTRGSDQNVEIKISFASLIHLPGQEQALKTATLQLQGLITEPGTREVLFYKSI